MYEVYTVKIKGNKKISKGKQKCSYFQLDQDYLIFYRLLFGHKTYILPYTVKHLQHNNNNKG